MVLPNPIYQTVSLGTWVNNLWSMRRTPLGGIMHGAGPLDNNARWQEEELLCRQK